MELVALIVVCHLSKAKGSKKVRDALSVVLLYGKTPPRRRGYNDGV